MGLKFEIDVQAISEQFKELKDDVSADLQKAVGNLAAITHAKVVEMANNELNSSRKTFMDSLGFEEILPGVWVVSVDESGLWIEEGIVPGKDMKPDLLKTAQTAKNGHKYKVIPFQYSRPPSQVPASTQNIVNYLKKELKKSNVPFKQIERNPDGSPKVGKLHEFNFGNPGGRLGGPGKGTTPALNKLNIYQHEKSNGKVERSILTFRTVTSGPASQDKWFHPGFEAKKYLDRALNECTSIWENQILPEILKKWE